MSLLRSSIASAMTGALVLASALPAAAAPTTIRLGAIDQFAAVNLHEDCEGTVSVRDPSLGSVEVVRDAPFDQPLVVDYTVGGDARNGTDYDSLPGTLTIPAGAASALIEVVPNEAVLEPAGGSEVTITLVQDAEQAPAGEATATVLLSAASSLAPCSVLTIAEVEQPAFVVNPVCNVHGAMTDETLSPVDGEVVVRRTGSLLALNLGYSLEDPNFTEPGPGEASVGSGSAAAVKFPEGESEVRISVAAIDMPYDLVLTRSPDHYAIGEVGTVRIEAYSFGTSFCAGPPSLSYPAELVMSVGEAMPGEIRLALDPAPYAGATVIRLVDGALPPGVTFVDGEFAGTATAAGTFRFSLQLCQVELDDEACNAPSVHEVTVAGVALLAGEELPSTGIPALPLALLALGSTGAGAGLVRRRRD